MSIVRDNLMTRPHYAPYCGLNAKCPGHWPRMKFDGEQFVCKACGYKTQFEPEFIAEYKVKREELAKIRPPEPADYL